MKIPAGRADRFVQQPGDEIDAVLLYGPDNGLVRERAQTLARAIVEDLSDPFLVTEITPGDLRDDRARLADEASALSMIGGRRVVRLRDATDSLIGAVDNLLDGRALAALVILEAGELSPRSRLRKSFEGAPRGAAIACYSDDPRALEGVIRDTLENHNLTVSGDALIYLRENLGGDRMISRTELEKLAAYCAGDAEVSLEAAVACVGDSAVMTLDDICFAAASGDQRALLRSLGRGFDEGMEPVRILRGAARHFMRLQFAAGAVSGGETVERAIKALRPPVFFKQQDQFRAQLRGWNLGELSNSVDALMSAELDCKTTGIPAEATCERALMRLAARGARHASR
jgi:DNA polymerase III subunit delta